MQTRRSKHFDLNTKITDASLSPDLPSVQQSTSGILHYIEISSPRAYATDFTFRSDIVLGLGSLVEYTGITVNPPTWSETAYGVNCGNPANRTHAITVKASTGAERFRVQDVSMLDPWGNTITTSLLLDLDLSIIP